MSRTATVKSGQVRSGQACTPKTGPRPKTGPPRLSEKVIDILEQEASLEESKRLSDIGVITVLVLSSDADEPE